MLPENQPNGSDCNDPRQRGFPHPVRFVVSWIVGLGFFAVSLFVLFKGEFLAAPVAFAMGVIFFPPANDFLYLKFEIDLCRRCKTWGFLIGLAIFFLALGPPG